MAFLKYDSKTGFMTTTDPDPSSLVNFVGSYKIKLQITDSVKVSKDVSFNVYVVCLDFKAKGSVELNRTKIGSPEPFIEYINLIGIVRVGFSRPIVIPNYTIYPKFKSENLMRQNCTNGEHCLLGRFLNN